MNAAELQGARTPRWDGYAWLFMRLSGLVLAFLVLGNLFVTMIADEGVYRIDFNFVAERWHSPFWRAWDVLLLWLAQLHGGNGLRGIIDDYSRRTATRRILKTVLVTSMLAMLVLGSYVVLTFDPDIS